MIKFITILLTIVTIQVNTASAKIYAREATSRYDADVLYKIVPFGGQKWFLGQCTGDITLRSQRLSIMEVNAGTSDVVRVTLVPSRVLADVVVCIR